MTGFNIPHQNCSSKQKQEKIFYRLFETNGNLDEGNETKLM